MSKVKLKPLATDGVTDCTTQAFPSRMTIL